MTYSGSFVTITAAFLEGIAMTWLTLQQNTFPSTAPSFKTRVMRPWRALFDPPYASPVNSLPLLASGTMTTDPLPIRLTDASRLPPAQMHSIAGHPADTQKWQRRSTDPLPLCEVIGAPVTALPFETQMDIIVGWAKRRLSKMVCVANAHMLVEAHWNDTFAAVLRQADLVTSDGMPLVWMMKLLGVRTQNRVAGMDILLALCHLSIQCNLNVFFLGCERSILNRMRERLSVDFPGLNIVGMEPLPFRPMTAAETADILAQIEASGANLVFVSLGCPKQEYWMAQHRDRIQAVMLGLGGAFPVYAGIKKWAPRWIRQAGLEWLYRLLQEPRRLAGRYGKTNQVFLWLALKQILRLGLQRCLGRRYEAN
jgi:N-acetylglucosaminyldiphosphoundecaprenol N-acetyl-beta-D-mannosaminyltransferase